MDYIKQKLNKPIKSNSRDEYSRKEKEQENLERKLKNKTGSRKFVSKKSRKARKSVSKKSRKARKSVSKKSRKTRKSVSKKSRKVRKSTKKSKRSHKSRKSALNKSSKSTKKSRKSHKKQKQSGGFNFAKLASAAVNVAKKAAVSNELRALGKDLANQSKNIATQMATNQINKAADKIAKETGVKVDTKLLKATVNKHIGAGKCRK